MANPPRIKLGLVTTTLRLTLGFYFFIGGLCAIALLLSSVTQTATLQQYTGTIGYVNRFVTDVFFYWLPPLWLFLIASAIATLIGFALLLGFLTRYYCIAAIAAILLQWFALPVMTLPRVFLPLESYTMPAMFVLSLQLGIAGLLLCQYFLGAGPLSLDNRLMQNTATPNTKAAKRCLHVAITYPLLIGALFGWHLEVPNFDMPPFVLLIVVILMQLPWILSRRIAATAVTLISIWYLTSLLSPDVGFLQNVFACRIALVYFFVGMILTHFNLGSKLATDVKQ